MCTTPPQKGTVMAAMAPCQFPQKPIAWKFAGALVLVGISWDFLNWKKCKSIEFSFSGPCFKGKPMVERRPHFVWNAHEYVCSWTPMRRDRIHLQICLVVWHNAAPFLEEIPRNGMMIPNRWVFCVFKVVKEATSQILGPKMGMDHHLGSRTYFGRACCNQTYYGECWNWKHVWSNDHWAWISERNWR